MAGLATGTALLITSSEATRAAESSPDESDYERYRRRATRHLGGGTAALVGGGLLVVGAALRYSGVARRLEPAVSLGPRGQGWLGVAGRF